MAWTKQQKAAIDSRNKNLLVAAAAGSGKTAVLVNRIAEMISEDNFNVNEMLIVTFTNAAAQEMRSRIHAEILKRMREEKDLEKLAKLERQSIFLSGASIMTFHSFCLDVLKRHFSKIDLDPKFRTAEENELKILKQEVVEELFEKNYENATQEFLKFTDEFGGNEKGDAGLHEIVTELYDFSQSRPYPEKWLNSLKEDYALKPSKKFDNLTWVEYALKIAKSQVKENLENALDECRAAKNFAVEQKIFADDKKISENWDKIIQIFEKDFFALDNIYKSVENWNELHEKIHAKKIFATYPGRMTLNEHLTLAKENLKNRRDAYKKIPEKLRDKIVTFKKEEISQEMKDLSHSVNELVRITIEFGKKFSDAKIERGIIDFNDMEHRALEILSDKQTAEIYRKKFSVIMVDEYQDTNGVQEEIISKFVRGENFFAVGDVKQSIYRFRQADPEIFMQKYEEYPKRDDCERIDLSMNFRSRREVIDAVNAIFEQVMTKKEMEIEYDEDAKLNLGANYPEHENTFDEPAEFFILAEEGITKNSSTDDDDEKTSDLEELENIERESKFIAEKIKILMNEKKFVWDDGEKKYRPITYKDIVILLRSFDKKAAKVVDVLKKNKIPAYAADKEGYFKAEEIQIILSLLMVLDNVRQDIPLAAVMLSPIGGFTAEDLANMRIKNRYADLYTLANENPELCGEFLNKINFWRERARHLSVPELLSEIYRDTGYYDYVGKNFRGEVAQANLRMLVDRAAQYEKTAFRGLSRFIKFMKKLRDLNNDLSAARTMGENENVVRVMTIHGSKGLEFPVVFVADLGKDFNTMDLKKNILLHRKLGIGIYRNVAGEYGLMRLPTFSRGIIKEKIENENRAEELRILYVALTRAREKLFLIGTIKKKAEDILKLKDSFDSPTEFKKISAQEIKSAKNFLSWLIPAAKNSADIIKKKIISVKDISLSENAILVEDEEKKIFEQPEKVADLPLKNIPAKISVTELKRRAEAEENPAEKFENLNTKKGGEKILYRRPNFELEKKLSGSEYGTLVHEIMQKLDLNSDLSVEGISTQINELADKKIIFPEHAKLVRVKDIFNFFQSPIGQRLLNSEEIYRELPFSRMIDAKDFFKNIPDEKIFIQGIIDLLFKDSATQKWILLDYKTDKPADDEIFRKRYKIQIQLYVQAVENLLNIKISEKYLFMLSTGKIISMS